MRLLVRFSIPFFAANPIYSVTQFFYEYIVVWSAAIALVSVFSAIQCARINEQDKVLNETPHEPVRSEYKDVLKVLPYLKVIFNRSEKNRKTRVLLPRRCQNWWLQVVQMIYFSSNDFNVFKHLYLNYIKFNNVLIMCLNIYIWIAYK